MALCEAAQRLGKFRMAHLVGQCAQPGQRICLGRSLDRPGGRRDLIAGPGRPEAHLGDGPAARHQMPHQAGLALAQARSGCRVVRTERQSPLVQGKHLDLQGRKNLLHFFLERHEPGCGRGQAGQSWILTQPVERQACTAHGRRRALGGPLHSGRRSSGDGWAGHPTTVSHPLHAKVTDSPFAPS